jgi:hypothetical protein
MAIRQKHLDELAPYLEPSGPTHENTLGHPEWDLYCPLHEDTRRSASMDAVTGEWYCFACNTGGGIMDLITRKPDWVHPHAGGSANGNVATAALNGHTRKPKEEITGAMIDGWASALLHNADESLDWMSGWRGLERDILSRYKIGWDHDRRIYTIPVYDDQGDLVVLRRYNPYPAEGRRKMWGVAGMNYPALYPLDQLPAPQIIICGGEWDALATIQAGYAAITRTAAERVWKSEWSSLFKGKQVFLCHDMDETGQTANRKVAQALRRVAEDIKVVHLPYRIEKKHGKDLSDFWHQFSAGDFEALLETAVAPYEPAGNGRVEEGSGEGPEVVTVLDSFDSRRVSEPVRLMVTIKGKREPGYSVPRKARLVCTQDAGSKCNVCPLNAAGGDATYEMESDDPIVLEMMESTSQQLHDIVRRAYGAQKCSRLEIQAEGHQAVEVLFARPSIDHHSGGMGDYKNIKLTSVGRHDTSTNQTVSAMGALYPNPRTQANEFQAWGVERVETSIDSYDLTAENYTLMRRFRPRKEQRPLDKLRDISDELAAHVTKIYGRPEMHMMMDLVWHSALEFRFRDEVIKRGWLEGLVLGDTRTGKSEAATRLSRHYSSGEVVNCEAASLAGVVGGLQQFGSGREWAVTWGAIPINDRRLVVLDEVSGLSPEAISQMSDIRSSGVAKLTKIQQEVTFARTRLIWLSNPRSAGMADFTWGVQAIAPLIGNKEDIARFDLVCAVALGDVPAEEINRPHSAGEERYTQNACSALVRWAWTRTPQQIRWQPGAERMVYRSALDVGKRYVEDPPLLQAANARVKIARVAVALALRLFSTPDGDVVLVTKEHVEDAVAFIDLLYETPSLGYAELSRERIRDRQLAAKNSDEVKKYLKGRRGLIKFLRSTGKFRRQDLEEVLNLSREEANGVINHLWGEAHAPQRGGRYQG